MKIKVGDPLKTSPRGLMSLEWPKTIKITFLLVNSFYFMGLLNFLFRCCLLILNRNKTSDAGHNIVTDGWAGVFNPHPHPNHSPNPPLTHSPTNKTNCSTLNTRFLRFQCERDISSVTDRQTNGPTDKASYRVACPQLKTDQEIYIVLYLIHTFFIFKLKQFGHQKTENWKFGKIEQNMRILGQKCACRATFT